MVRNKGKTFLCKWAGYLLVMLWCSTALAQQTGTVTYVYTDPQGTPLAEADANGNITATFDYAPYGSQALGTPPDGPGYTAHVNDPDTGLVYMQARYYDPVTERFLSIDPAGITPGNVFNFNRYIYASNNPILNIDTDGRQDYSAQYLSAYGDCASSPGCNPQQVPQHIATATLSGLSSASGLLPVVGDVQNVNEAIRNPTIGNISIAAIGALPEIGPTLAKSIKTADHLIEAAGKLTRLKGGVRQGEVVGDAKTLMGNITHGGEKISGGRVKMSDGTIIGAHTSTKTGVSTIDINKGDKIYKIRVHNESSK